MDILLIAVITVDAVAALLCLKARAYTVGIALCAVAVPISLLITTLMFAANDRQTLRGADPVDEFVLLGAACLLTAVVAAAWALIVGAVRLRHRRRFPIPARSQSSVRSLY
ncbi:MAG: hypothetical protein KIT69_18025 [Propionibacteriaceae bacterium]|nr:hypothetical protein [Propionibacteriaceae bacterium]